jgi:hypothetical protein
MLNKRVRNEYNNEFITEATAETAAAVATTAPIFFVFLLLGL